MRKFEYWYKHWVTDVLFLVQTLQSIYVHICKVISIMVLSLFIMIMNFYILYIVPNLIAWVKKDKETPKYKPIRQVVAL